MCHIMVTVSMGNSSKNLVHKQFNHFLKFTDSRGLIANPFFQMPIFPGYIGMVGLDCVNSRVECVILVANRLIMWQ